MFLYDLAPCSFTSPRRSSGSAPASSSTCSAWRRRARRRRPGADGRSCATWRALGNTPVRLRRRSPPSSSASAWSSSAAGRSPTSGSSSASPATLADLRDRLLHPQAARRGDRRDHAPRRRHAATRGGGEGPAARRAIGRIDAVRPVPGRRGHGAEAAPSATSRVLARSCRRARSSAVVDARSPPLAPSADARRQRLIRGRRRREGGAAKARRPRFAVDAHSAGRQRHHSAMPRPRSESPLPLDLPVPPTDRFEKRARRKGARLVAGVDEAGRGPLAGPVVVAAVLFEGRIPKGLDDSKKLTAPGARAALRPDPREGRWSRSWWRAARGSTA